MRCCPSPTITFRERNGVEKGEGSGVRKKGEETPTAQTYGLQW